MRRRPEGATASKMQGKEGPGACEDRRRDPTGLEALQRAEIERRVGIGVASVYRVLADAKRKRDGQKSAV